MPHPPRPSATPPSPSRQEPAAGRSAAADRPVQVAVLALPRCTLAVLGCVVDCLRLANRAAARDIYAWTIVGLQATVVSSTEVALAAARSIDDVDGLTPDVVVICGGLEGHRFVDRRVLAWLRALDLRGAITAAVSTGVWSLAHAGLLDGRRCAVHWEDAPSFTACFPRTDVRDEIFTQDGRRMTCPGGVAVVDMMLHLVTIQHGRALADAVADLMIHAPARAAGDRQRPGDAENPMSSGVVKRAVALMEDNAERVLPIDVIAMRVGRSTRQLERAFGEAFGVPPKRFYDLLRLRRARKLLAETDLTVTEIAIRCGYQSSTQFAAQYRHMFGRSPRQDRGTGNSEPGRGRRVGNR